MPTTLKPCRQSKTIKSKSGDYAKNQMKKAIISTEKGAMKVEFFEKDAPNTVLTEPVQEAPAIPSIANWMVIISITIAVCFRWRMQAEIQVVHSSLFATAAPTHLISIAAIPASEKW
jgi:hypothetical protein